MRRRECIALLGGAAIGLTFPAKAQQASKIARIGYLSVAAGRNPLDETFEQALHELGWIINQNIAIEYRYAGGRQDKIAPITEEVIRSDPDALVVWGPPLALAAKRMTTQIPVVFLMTFDPVERFKLGQPRWQPDGSDGSRQLRNFFQAPPTSQGSCPLRYPRSNTRLHGANPDQRRPGRPDRRRKGFGPPTRKS